MNTNPISLANSAKGPLLLCKRAIRIAGRYGLTSGKMGPSLHLFADTLNQFNCGASFPVTAVTLERHADFIKKCFENANIELAVHGYTHIDYSRLPAEERLAHLTHAREVFIQSGLPPAGYRSPYLRRDRRLAAAIEETGFSYSSNQPIVWDVLDPETLPSPARSTYKRAITFYEPWHASERLSLPRLENQLVEIPVSLPDDEILLDRLDGTGDELVAQTWQRILSETFQRGELFTLQLHPERIARCVQALYAVLQEARSLKPSVWCARLDEIADWWRSRTNTEVKIAEGIDNRLRFEITGHRGTVVLARGVEVDGLTSPWADGYCRVHAMSFTANSLKRPFIGLSSAAPSELADFLRQQGYIVEIGKSGDRYSYYFDQTSFNVEEERKVLAKIEETGYPLVKLGRWPDGAHSALAVTGDIDAVTLWDYGRRFFGG